MEDFKKFQKNKKDMQNIGNVMLFGLTEKKYQRKMKYKICVEDG